MTLVEFLAPLSNGTHQNRILAVLYFCERYEQQPTLTVERIRQRLQAARIVGWKKLNVADVLNKSGAFADADGLEGGRRLWKLTESGREHVRTMLGLPSNEPEIEHDVSSLTTALAKVSDLDVLEYLDEALKCLRVGALRPCVVSVWVAAARTIQNAMMSKGAPAVTSAVQKHDLKARQIKAVDDFAYVKEAVQLLAALDLGVLDKSQKDTLVDALNLRNKCGHPSKYKPGMKKVSAFMEDVISIVFV